MSRVKGSKDLKPRKVNSRKYFYECIETGEWFCTAREICDKFGIKYVSSVIHACDGYKTSKDGSNTALKGYHFRRYEITEVFTMFNYMIHYNNKEQ